MLQLCAVQRYASPSLCYINISPFFLFDFHHLFRCISWKFCTLKAKTSSKCISVFRGQNWPLVANIFLERRRIYGGPGSSICRPLCLVQQPLAQLGSAWTEKAPQRVVGFLPCLGIKIDLLFHLSARKLPSLAMMKQPSDIMSEINRLRPEGTAMTI